METTRSCRSLRIRDHRIPRPGFVFHTVGTLSKSNRPQLSSLSASSDSIAATPLPSAKRTPSLSSIPSTNDHADDDPTADPVHEAHVNEARSAADISSERASVPTSRSASATPEHKVRGDLVTASANTDILKASDNAGPRASSPAPLVSLGADVAPPDAAIAGKKTESGKIVEVSTPTKKPNIKMEQSTSARLLSSTQPKSQPERVKRSKSNLSPNPRRSSSTKHVTAASSDEGSGRSAHERSASLKDPVPATHSDPAPPPTAARPANRVTASTAASRQRAKEILEAQKVRSKEEAPAQSATAPAGRKSLEAASRSPAKSLARLQPDRSDS